MARVTNMKRRKNRKNPRVLDWKEMEVPYPFNWFCNSYLNIEVVCMCICVYKNVMNI